MSSTRSQSSSNPLAPYRLTSKERKPGANRQQRPPKARATDGAIRHWLDTFHRHHTESDDYTPVALRMDPPVPPSGDANGSTLQPAATRIVYEIALRRDARGETWVLICWEVDVPGIRFCDCADRAEALALFAEPQLAASRWQTVRIRPEFRPW
ncbi:MAG: hypothetical protein U1A78_18820 [Polyangia bacterium]